MTLAINEISRFVDFPVPRVHLELTNACNFDCSFCPKPLMTRPKGYMDPQLARRILDELARENLAQKATFHVMGEPFLHPQLFPILEYGRDKGVSLGVTTNGSLLTPKTADRLLELVQQVNISLQTPDEISFALRGSRSLRAEEYFEGILGFIDRACRRGNETTIKLHLLNSWRMPSLGALGDSSGDPIRVIEDKAGLHGTLKEWVRRIYRLEGIREKEKEGRVLEAIASVSFKRWNVLEVYPNIYLETYMLDDWGNSLAAGPLRRARMGYCPAIRDHFAILWNGDLVLCCRDFDGKTALGNVRERSLLDILSSPPAIGILRGFRRYRVLHPHCQECLGGATLPRSLFRQLGSILLWKGLKKYLYVTRRLY